MRRLIFLALLLPAVSAQAQNPNFWQKLNKMLTTISNIDSTYVYQPKQGFTVGVFTTVQRAGFDVNIGFKVNRDEGEPLHGMSIYTLNEQTSTKLGLELGYGKIVLDYGIEIGHKGAYKKRAFALNFLGKSWGLHFNYFNIQNPFESTISIGEETDPEYWNEHIVARDPSTLRRLAIDGYYVFNNKRFAYPATYKAGLVQRRTNGSWMVTMRYMQGSLYNSPESAYDAYNLLDGFATIQASIGGGYSGNIVCWHRDPTEPRDKGLRNLTLNLTAMPVITVFNFLKTTSYKYDDEGRYTGADISKVYCYPTPNFIGSAALALSLDRFFLSAQFAYNMFYFQSTDAINAEKLHIPAYVDDLKFRGSFHDWKVKVLFTYKF